VFDETAIQEWLQTHRLKIEPHAATLSRLFRVTGSANKLAILDQLFQGMDGLSLILEPSWNNDCLANWKTTISDCKIFSYSLSFSINHRFSRMYMFFDY
jgi:hypothetical protein